MIIPLHFFGLHYKLPNKCKYKKHQLRKKMTYVVLPGGKHANIPMQLLGL